MIDHAGIFNAIKARIDAVDNGGKVVYSSFADTRNRELQKMLAVGGRYNFWICQPGTIATTSEALGRAEVAVTWTLMHGYQLNAAAPDTSRQEFDARLEAVRREIITNPTLGGKVLDISRAARQPYGMQVLTAYEGNIFRVECHVADCALTVRIAENI